MDLTLTLSYQEQNDNQAIVLTDISNYGKTGDSLNSGNLLVKDVLYQITTDGGNGTFTGNGSNSAAVGSRFVANAVATLGVGDSCIEVTPYASEITAATLDITITDSSGTATVYSQIDLYSVFGLFSSEDDLVYTIDKSYIGGSNGDEIVDGIYAIKYNITYTGTNQSDSEKISASELGVSVLVYGVVKVKVYDKLRQIPKSYDCKDCDTKSVTNEADFLATYLSSIEKSAYIAKTEELIIMLLTLESMLNNSSSIIW